jgi:hypothetical protein
MIALVVLVVGSCVIRYLVPEERREESPVAEETAKNFEISISD